MAGNLLDGEVGSVSVVSPCREGTPHEVPAEALRPGDVAWIDGEWRTVHAVMVAGGRVHVRVDDEGVRVTLRASVGTMVEVV